MATAVERVTELVAPIVADFGLELYDLEHAGGVLKVIVDRDGGVDLDAIAAVTRNVSRELDHADPIPGRYTLEVTSPGLERPLRTQAHFARAIGAKVHVRTRPGVEGDRRVTGVLTTADSVGFVVQPDGEPERRLRYDDIDRARTVFEWVRGEKPGHGKTKGGPQNALVGDEHREAAEK